VCFFARNDESIEGTKEILRALSSTSRLPTTPDLRVFPILARLPELGEDDEREILADVSARLELASMPSIEPVMIVHSYPALQIEERLLMLEDDSNMLESQLYADYARFFSLILPPQIAESSLRRSIDDAQKLAYKNPTEAEKILIRIAHRQPHVFSYRALLEFYRLRTEKPKKLIEAAKKVAELSNDYGDELVWNTLVDNLDEIASEPDRDALQLLERAWRTRGSNDADVGLRLADALHEIEDGKRAVAVLMSLAESQPSVNGELLAKIVNKLVLMGLAKTALLLSPVVRRELRVPALQRAWARAVTGAQSRDEAAELLARSDVNEATFRTRPSSWFELLRLTGQQERVIPAARKFVDELISVVQAEGLTRRHDLAVKQLYEVLAQDGSEEIFLEQLKVNLTKSSERLRFRRLQREVKRSKNREDVG
jgi:predicted nucleic acid-binding protein